MQYALLIYERPGSYDGLSDDERESISAEYMAIRGEEAVVGGAHLEPADSATTVRAEGGDTLTTDGPFADTKEILGGYFVVDAPDIDVALAVSERIPAVRMGGSVEVRPIAERS